MSIREPGFPLGKDRRPRPPVASASATPSRTSGQCVGVGLKNLVLDLYANVGYKADVDRPLRVVPSWIPEPQQRRLAVYKVLTAYVSNVGRLARPYATQADADSQREYGDCELLVERIAAGVLGDDPQIVVDGADDDLADGPALPDAPTDPGPQASPIERRVFDAQSRVFERRAAAAIDRWEQAWNDQPALVDRQEWLREWADAEMFDQRMWENETGASALGDAVYVLYTSSRAGRPVVRVYDPGFYFPVLDDEAEALGFPTTVHLAWEEDIDGDGQTDHVRRVTWRLGLIQPRMVEDARGRMVPAVRRIVTTPGPDGLEPIAVDLPAGDGDEPTLFQGDSRDRNGFVVRRYPWAMDTDAYFTCFMSDARWALRDLRGKPVFDFEPSRAQFMANEDGLPIRDLDLRIDFIPVVHAPNTPSSQTHFGKSDLARVLQLVDDIADVDTDTQKAAALAGLPMVGASGASVPAEITVKPGAVLGLGENGRLDVIDLSASVAALRELSADLRDLFSVNSQVSAEVLGRVKANEVPSGLALAFGLGPYRSLITVKRLVRDHKYRLFLKFVQRMAQAMGALPPGPTMFARVAFGSFLPADRKQLVDEVVALVGAHLLSRSSGLRLLVAAGVEVGDIPEELRRIASEDFVGAGQLVDATGDDDAARAYLGLPAAEPGEQPEEPPAPTPEPPVTPTLVL